MDIGLTFLYISMEIYEMVDHLKSVYLKKLQMLFNFISFVCVCVKCIQTFFK